MEYNKYRLEYPKNKKELSEKLMNSPNLSRLSTFGASQDEEISYLMKYDEQRQSNLIGLTYIRDILWLESEETIGICGLMIERSSRAASWKIILFEPYATPQLCTVILLEYLSIAKCLSLAKVVVTLPHQGMHNLQTLSLILESNGFQNVQRSAELNVYSIELRDVVEDLQKYTPLYNEIGVKHLDCRGCGNSFIFSTEEQIIYHEKGDLSHFLPPISLLLTGFVFPKRCPKCRLIKKIALQNLQSESESSSVPSFRSSLLPLRIFMRFTSCI
jgi:hypothetical protein